MKKVRNASFRLARPEEAGRVIDFINSHFDIRLALVNLPEFFDHYYRTEDTLQFALAEEEGEILAAAGYILANRAPQPDIWVSVWVAKKGCNGVGLELMNALPGLTGARVVACNNIRPETCVFYRFLGWTAERIPHYYRLAPRAQYRLAQPPAGYAPLPVGGDLTLEPVADPTALAALGLPPTGHTPSKDLWYITRRYFTYPHRRYDVYSVQENGRLLAYLMVNLVDAYWDDETLPHEKVLRIVDFIGEDEILPRLGKALDELLLSTGAEYADCYCWGIPDSVFAAAGFTQRLEGDGAVIPNYLTSVLPANTEYCFFTNQPEGFVLFKADGDQDRPNIPV